MYRNFKKILQQTEIDTNLPQEVKKKTNKPKRPKRQNHEGRNTLNEHKNQKHTQRPLY